MKRAVTEQSFIKFVGSFERHNKWREEIHLKLLFKKWLVFTIRLAAIMFLAFGCQSQEDKKMPEVQGNAEVKQAQVPKTVSSMLVRYCTDYGAVKLRTNIGKEMGYFCNNNQPTPEMIALVEAIHMDPQGKAPLRVVKAEHTPDLWSDFWIVWGFKAPSAPIALKNRPIYDYIAKGTTSQNLKLVASALRRPDEAVDHGLQIWSATLNYDLTILGSNNLTIPTKRNTEYNLYQIKAASEEMGLGVEHLTDVANSDYKLSTMINLSFMNDSPGSTGGSVNLSLSHIKIFNRGFSSTASTAMTEISQFLADAMYGAMQ